MRKQLNQEVKATISKIAERGIDVSLISREIEIVIDDLWPDYETERDWGQVARRLRLI